MSQTVGYWDYDATAALTCPACGWSGKGSVNHFDELLDVRCQECDQIIVLVPYPTAAETRAAAAAGNPGAIEELAVVEAREAFQEQAQRGELKDASQLPELPGDRLVIEWDKDGQDTVLRHEGTEIWRELAYYEGYERFATVFQILRERYGFCLAEVRPTERSWIYLYGDALRAPQMIDALNKSLLPPDEETGPIGTRQVSSDEDAPRDVSTGVRVKIGGRGPVVAESDATGWRLTVRGRVHARGAYADTLHIALRDLALQDPEVARVAFGVVMNCAGAWEDEYTEEHGADALTFDDWMERIEAGGVIWVNDDGELETSG